MAGDHLVESYFYSSPFLTTADLVTFDVVDECVPRRFTNAVRTYHDDVIFYYGGDTEFGVKSFASGDTMSGVNDVVNSTRKSGRRPVWPGQ